MDQPKEIIMEWDYSIPLYGNRFLALDMGKALGLPLLVIACLIGWSVVKAIESGNTISLYGLQYALTFVCIIIFFVLLLLWIVYQNRFDTHFTIDKDSIRFALNPGHRKRSRWISNLLIILAVFSRKPGMVGTGLIAQSSESSEIAWSDIYSVKYWDRLHAVSLRNSWRQIGVLYCPADLYEKIKTIIQQELEPRFPRRKKEMSYIIKDRWWKVGMLIPASLSVFFLSAIYEYDWDNKIVLYLIGIWLMLSILVPGWLRRLFAIIGWVGIGFTWIALVIPEWMEGPYAYDNIRIAFFSLGILLSSVTLFLCYKNHKSIR